MPCSSASFVPSTSMCFPADQFSRPFIKLEKRTKQARVEAEASKSQKAFECPEELQVFSLAFSANVASAKSRPGSRGNDRTV